MILDTVVEESADVPENKYNPFSIARSSALGQLGPIGGGADVSVAVNFRNLQVASPKISLHFSRLLRQTDKTLNAFFGPNPHVFKFSARSTNYSP